MDLSYRTWEWDCKSLFYWSTLFLDKDMQVNTEGGLQNKNKTKQKRKEQKSRMYCTVEMALDRGVTWPRTVQKDLTQQLPLFVIFNPLL